MIPIIAYKNNPYDLAVLLVQLQSQIVKPSKIYLADNSKSGQGLELAKRYQWDVEIHVQRNVGSIHQSWNKGIKFAGDEDVVILNDDLMIPNDFISVMEKYCATGEADMYCPAVAGFPPTEKVRKHYEWYSKSELSYYMIDHRIYELAPIISGWCFGLPKATREKIGVFDERFALYFGDTDYETRIFNAGGKVCFIKGLQVQHFGSSSSRKIEHEAHEKLYKHDEDLFKAKWPKKEEVKSA